MTAPRLGFSWEGGDPDLRDAVLPLVDVLELTPETLVRLEDGRVRLDPDRLGTLDALRDRVAFTIHGVSLSIASCSGWNAAYLDLVEEMVGRLPVLWHSEHLGWTVEGGEFVGTMFPVPRIPEALGMLVGRIARIRERIPLPFLLENVSCLVPTPYDEMDLGEFLRRMCEETGCGLLLDLRNLECDAANEGRDPEEILSTLPLEHVREIHIAGGVAHRGWQVDVHSRTVAGSTLDLLRRWAPRMPELGLVVWELMSEAFPVLGADRIAEELRRLRGVLAELGG